MDGSSAQSPIPIPPLVPLPGQQHAKAKYDKEDVFATLFSPPTPHASPTHTPEPGQSRPARHARTESTDSEFGAFVSVSSSEDPLKLGDEDGQPAFSPVQTQSYFGKFAQDARAASEKKRREVLDELLRHEDDPLYWLQGSSGTESASGKSTPLASTSSNHEPETPSLIDLDSPSEERMMKPLVPPLLSRSPTPASTASAQPVQPRQVPEDTLVDLDSPGPKIKATESQREARPSTSPQHVKTSPHVRSPSLPPSSPTRMSPPEIQRTQSYFSSPSFPSRIVSTLLSSTIRPSASRATPATATTASTSGHSHTLPPVVSAAASHLSGFSRSVPHSRAATVSEGVTMSNALDASITHGTPFASHPFVPPSGAPGFAGDRQWDKGFEYDKTQVERKSVRLVGRKEFTVPVLTVEIADMLRPFFPALARLPRSWTLLYSLDQHGISLNTLYARCQDFKGSALLVIRDSNDAIFGAWMGEGIHPSKGAYYGSGESFLWQLVGKDRVRVFKWTGKNDYVALCEPDYISFGGGDGHYGLWLDQTLSDGSSARCLTFDNEPLCSPGPRQGETVTFECVGLEVWGIG
ncbi:hypothetical protein BN946_scf184752.g4 [Trametes cinnabarina]|uniref:Oxidation resistance protein 1 n=1 Tax=Pycnoporus cinnabarinus TaxID=5643 RepID=A0A060SR72_PYCCI|nr:hypothetical protein BN946_scf184752.g4 [Trametes cinnabarina]